MEIIKYYCDQCGTKLIKGEHEKSLTLDIYTNVLAVYMNRKKQGNFIFCHSCKKELPSDTKNILAIDYKSFYDPDNKLSPTLEDYRFAKIEMIDFKGNPNGF